MFIRSERLFLRPGWPEDWAELHERIGDEGIVRNLAQVPWPYEPGDARAFAGKPQEPRTPHFLVTLPGVRGSELVGCVGLARDEVDDIELGYWIAREHWGHGYATEAVRAVLGLARALGHGRVVAGHFVDNPASGRVLVKCGFRPLGSLRHRYSVARGGAVPTLAYAIDLAGPADCDADDTVSAMRAA